MNDADLARFLSLIADSLEGQNQATSGGILRQAARRIVELTEIVGEVGGCERCGIPLKRKSTGRPRRFCSERCRKRAGKFTLAS